MNTLKLDTLILGGGIAGLWLLDDLHRGGHRALLLEKFNLGQGQTVTSQGILHGGLKYTLTGQLTGSAKAIRDAPKQWRDCLEGRTLPDLTHTQVRSPFCYLWRTRSWRSVLGSIGARRGLRIAPVKLPHDQRPDVLSQCPGDVMRLDEQVIDPGSLIADLATQHEPRIGQFEKITFEHGDTLRVAVDEQQTLEPTSIVLTAGQGNAALREQLGLSTNVMQRRPLHMVMVRGQALPKLNGHCVDGKATRLTITTATDLQGNTIWQLGGQLAERGVDQTPEVLVRHARREVEAVLPGPGFDTNGFEWATYRVDRAEAQTTGLLRPEGPTVLQDGNVITAWPTKLVLAPHLSQKIGDLLPPPKASADPVAWPTDLPRPSVAQPPWESCKTWTLDP